jgi:glutamyl-tRNA synthetase
MERLGIYKEWSEKLVSAGKAYRCYCTKEELDAQRRALKARDPKAEFRYPGTCRARADQPDKPFVVRFKVPESGVTTYVDKVFGEVKTPNSAQQDFVLLRADGVPLYNFGCVVDDITMEITLVARGRDHMVNTPPQIMLYEAFGAKVPELAHLPMMLNKSGAKLSKRDGAVGVFEYRDLGYHPQAVLDYLVRFGWSHGDQEIFSREELVAAFDWEACGRGDGKFDPKKFEAIQYDFIKRADLVPDHEYAERTLPFLDKRGLSGVRVEDVKRAVYTVRERSKTFVEAAERLDFFFREPPDVDEKAAREHLTPDAADRLARWRGVLAEGEWTEEALEERTNRFLELASMEMRSIAQPARVALTGKTASPGIFQVLFVLGRDRALARLDAGVERARRGA